MIFDFFTDMSQNAIYLRNIHKRLLRGKKIGISGIERSPCVTVSAWKRKNSSVESSLSLFDLLFSTSCNSDLGKKYVQVFAL